MKQIVLIAAMFIAMLVIAVEEQTPAAELQLKMAELTTFSASFTQTTSDTDGFLLDELQGKLFFSRPNHLRWEASAPYSQTMVADGETIYLYDPDLAQVTVRPWSNDPSENPAVIFLSGTDLSNDFVVSFEGDIYTLMPRAESSTIFSLSVSLDEGVPSAMIIDDALGQKTKIEFNDAKVGEELDQSMFQFDISEGIDVITDG